MAYPSPYNEPSAASARGARIFTKLVAVLSVIIIGGTILLNQKTLTLEDYLALIGPFVFLFFIYLWRRHLVKETGVEWIPPL